MLSYRSGAASSTPRDALHVYLGPQPMTSGCPEASPYKMLVPVALPMPDPYCRSLLTYGPPFGGPLCLAKCFHYGSACAPRSPFRIAHHAPRNIRIHRHERRGGNGDARGHANHKRYGFHNGISFQNRRLPLVCAKRWYVMVGICCQELAKQRRNAGRKRDLQYAATS